MDDMYRRGYGRGPMYYPPQQIDPSIVSFGQVQMYDPEQYERIGAAIADSQARYDASQAAIAQHISDVGAADIEQRHRNEYMAQMHEGLEDLYSGIMKDYQGDVGRASARVIQNLSKDRGLMNQLAHDTAREREAFKEYQQLKVAGKAPRIIDTEGNVREVPFDMYHNLGHFDSQGNFIRGEFNPLRSAADVATYVSNNITKALNEHLEQGGLHKYKGVGIDGMLEHITRKGYTQRELSDYFDIDLGKGYTQLDQITDQLLKEVPGFIDEFENMSAEERHEAAKKYVEPIIRNQVHNQYQRGFLQDPNFDRNSSDTVTTETPLIPIFTKPVETNSVLDKKVNNLTKTIEKTKEITIQEDLINHIQDLNNTIVGEGKEGIINDVSSAKFKTRMESFVDNLYGIHPSDVQKVLYKGFEEMYEEASNRYKDGLSTADDLLLFSEYNKDYYSGKNLWDRWLDFDKQVSKDMFASSEKDKKRLDIGTQVLGFMTNIEPSNPLHISYKTAESYGKGEYNSDNFKPDSPEYLMRSNLLKIVAEGSKKTTVSGINIIKDVNGNYTFEHPKNMSKSKADEKLRIASVEAANRVTNQLMVSQQKRQDHVSKLYSEVEKEVKKNPLVDIFVAEEMLKGTTLEKASENILTTYRNTLRDESAKVHFVAPFKSLAESSGTRSTENKENVGWIRELMQKELSNNKKGSDAKGNKLSDLKNYLGLDPQKTSILSADFNFNDFTLEVTYSKGVGTDPNTYYLDILSLVDEDPKPMLTEIKKFTDRVANMEYVVMGEDGKKSVQPIILPLGDMGYSQNIGLMSIIETIPDKLNKDESMYKPTLYAVVFDKDGSIVGKSTILTYGNRTLEVGRAMREIFSQSVFDGLNPYAREGKKLQKKK